MTVAELLKRARSASGKGVKYKLSAGGMNPLAPSPANIANECDCTGYENWCFVMSRKTDHPLYVAFNGGWANTDAIVHDAKTVTGFFEQIAFPRIGCVIVYPSKPPGRKSGHIGIVTEMKVDNFDVKKVIHCSSGNYRKFGDAIQETGPEVFNVPDAIFAWYAGVV